MNKLLMLITLLNLLQACTRREDVQFSSGTVVKAYAHPNGYEMRHTSSPAPKFVKGTEIVLTRKTYKINEWTNGGNVLCKDERELYDGNWYVVEPWNTKSKDTTYFFQDIGNTTCDGFGHDYDGYRLVMFFEEYRKGKIITKKNWWDFK